MVISHRIRLLSVLLLALLICSLFACGEETVDETSESPVLDRVGAAELLERDKLVTDIFVRGVLSSGNYYSQRALPEDSEYRAYSRVAELLDSTYLPREGGDADFFRSYPEGYTPTVTERDGVTYVYPHTSAFSESVNLATVSVSDTEDEGVKLISAQTASGTDVTFNAHYSDGKWLLETGLYRTLGLYSGECELSGGVGHGSMQSLDGEILVISFFVSDKSTSFTSEEEAAYNGKIRDAVESVTEAAHEYGADFNFTYASAYFNHMDIVGTRSIDFDIVFSETGFGTLQKFAEKNFDLELYDNYFFVVCLDKDAETQYDLSLGTENTELYTAERIIVGQNSTSRQISRALLSLMGVRDIAMCDCTESVLYREYFPDEIMHSDSAEATLSPVNAYICGLTDELPFIYHVFLDN